MNRNSYQASSYSNQPNQNPYQTTSSAFRDSKSRSPLYPIGPTLTQPQFRPIQKGTSPYISRQGMMPPSYQQKYLHQSNSNFANPNQISMGKKFDQTKINYEDRQKDIIQRNQVEIEQQHKRRDQIRLSYEREIHSKTNSASRNQERKMKLLAEVQSLQLNHDQLHERLMGLRPPTNKLNVYEPIDRKQQQMIILKNKLVSQIRQKEEDLHKEEEQEENHWEQQLLQKERILLKLQTEQHNKRTQLNIQKNQVQKPNFESIQDQIRQERYKDFLFQAEELQRKINSLTEERQRINNDFHHALSLKKPQIHNLRLAHEDFARDRQELSLRVLDLDRIGKEMEEANNNLLNEVNRKQQMITKYEKDIQILKDKKKQQQYSMNKLFKEVRDSPQNELIPGLAKQIVSIQQEVRFEQTNTTRLKTQYQRLYELLCSATNKNLHQTFNSIHSKDLMA